MSNVEDYFGRKKMRRVKRLGNMKSRDLRETKEGIK